MSYDPLNPYHLHEWHLWANYEGLGIYRCPCRQWASKDWDENDYVISNDDTDVEGHPFNRP